MKPALLLLLLLPFTVRADELVVKMEAPKPKVADKKFWFAMSVLAASQATDGVTTFRSLERGCKEDNPTFGKHPSVGRFVAVDSAYIVGEAMLAYALKKFSVKHRWARHLWLIEPSIQTEQHIFLARRNESLRCR